jgi:hypothetical protein
MIRMETIVQFLHEMTPIQGLVNTVIAAANLIVAIATLHHARSPRPARVIKDPKVRACWSRSTVFVSLIISLWLTAHWSAYAWASAPFGLQWWFSITSLPVYFCAAVIFDHMIDLRERRELDEEYRNRTPFRSARLVDYSYLSCAQGLRRRKYRNFSQETGKPPPLKRPAQETGNEASCSPLRAPHHAPDRHRVSGWKVR